MTDIAEIEERNELRREAKLPLLDIGAELSRMYKIEAQLRYEAFAAPLREKMWKALVAERGRPSGWAIGMSWGSEIERRIKNAYKRSQS